MPDTQTIPASLRQQIAASTLFTGLPDSAIDTLMQEGRILSFKAGAQLIVENQDNEYLFLILQGSASAQMNDTPVGDIQAGEFAGEISSAGISPPVASVIATSDIEAAAFPVSLIHALAEAHPDFSSRLLEAGFHRISD
ncbi:MAG: cyclic nucleotide-binding domain-containing protein [Mariprofundaceae bacterium]